MESFTFQPEGVCSRQMTVYYEDGVVKKLEVVGGCNGNLQGISALVVGMKIDDVIAKLSGITCRGSRTKITSCPDQLARGLKQLKAEKGI